ncbi:hypothetical protein QI305_05145 [Staphylococcus saprophyticus]|uniref:hypothetical protein n=1 Tax=Staphylococcus saprophyticus TaxID=29385 RepID=UPI0022EA3504|nr:hypothetical protein [Staphylococcus saprophyticus]MDW3954653.1 hypothetical protein [Staphylococcus saprophyticus]MDW4022327.1 hypothetical protein [Staphylococcus saprophyticus]
MNITELQRLDFLLKRVNEENDSESYKIVIQMNNEFYSCNFIPNIQKLDNTNERKVAFRDFTKNEGDHFTYIDLEDLGTWFKVFERPHGSEHSDFNLLKKRSVEYESAAYYTYLLNRLNNHDFKFAEELPPYIYNLKSLTSDFKLDFIKINKNTQFEVISLIPENTI